MTLTNANTIGNAQNHRLDGLTVHGDLLVTGPQGVSNALGVDSNNNLRSNGILTGQPTLQELIDGHTPTNTVRCAYPRQMPFSNVAPLSTGRMSGTVIPLYAGDVINYITYFSGTQAAVTPTAWWFALYDNNPTTPALLAQTADQTSTAWAATTRMTLQLQSTVTITQTGLYVAAIMMAAGTVVSLEGASSSTAVGVDAGISSARRLMFASNTGLTTTAPVTATIGAVTGHYPCILASTTN